MELIHSALGEWNHALPTVRVPVERLALAKRRWRGVAEDGAEFGFDLETPLADGAPIFATSEALYIIAQKYEPVLEIALGSASATAARLGWLIGNLHFQMEITDDVVRVADDDALRQLFFREGLAFTECKRVFHPLAGGHHH